MDNIEKLEKAITTRNAMIEYQDTVYLRIIKQINNDAQDVLKGNLGSEFVRNASRDLAGEVVRNCFDTSNYNITVDQLAKRILEFSYDDEYDPLSSNGSERELTKLVYNYGEKQSAELEQIATIMENSQKKLFTEDRKQDDLDRKGKIAYRESVTNEDGTVYDDLTGREGQTNVYYKNGKPFTRSELHADHIQARESATYNERYLKESGIEELKVFWNSSDNMQMIHQSANTSKGDIRVCIINGKVEYVNARSADYDPSTDITYKATPEQLADATCAQWEKIDESKENSNQKKIQTLKDKGYLDENGKVPKAVRKKLVSNIKASQNAESTVILKNTNYKQVSIDSAMQTKGAIGKIVAGQIIYYTAPPVVYEIKEILKDKDITIENALDRIAYSMKRIGEYVFSKLKDIFSNILTNSLKRFIKSFMDILINLVKATIKKLLKLGKNLVLSTVDAVRIIADKNSTSSEKADAVFNLYGVTITSCVVEILFELAGNALHIPEPFDDIIFGPLQIITTVICTNLTLLLLKKLDLFNVQYGFKMSQIRNLFKDANEQYLEEFNYSKRYADEEIARIIEKAKEECKDIYHSLEEIDIKEESARGSLEKINHLFSMDIDFDKSWLMFLGVSL